MKGREENVDTRVCESIVWSVLLIFNHRVYEGETNAALSAGKYR